MNNSTVPGVVACVGGLNCMFGGLVAIVLMGIITVMLLLLSAVLCCKLVKKNEYIAEKLSETNSPLIA